MNFSFVLFSGSNQFPVSLEPVLPSDAKTQLLLWLQPSLLTVFLSGASIENDPRFYHRRIRNIGTFREVWWTGTVFSGMRTAHCAVPSQQLQSLSIGGCDKNSVPLTFFVFKVRLCSYVGPLWQNRWKIFWERFWQTEFLFSINHVSLPPPKKKETYSKIKNILFIFYVVLHWPPVERRVSLYWTDVEWP